MLGSTGFDLLAAHELEAPAPAPVYLTDTRSDWEKIPSDVQVVLGTIIGVVCAKSMLSRLQ